MKCPSCGTPQAQPSVECKSCGLTLKSLDDRFGFVPRHRASVTDLGQILSLKELKKVERCLKQFNRKYPGVAFAVVLTKLPPMRKPSEYCFWLINRGNFADSEAKLGRNRTILLLLDFEGPAASLMVGYGLESIFSEDDLKHAVGTAVPFLKGDDLCGAAIACVQAVDPILCQRLVAMVESRGKSSVAGNGAVSALNSVSRVSS